MPDGSISASIEFVARIGRLASGDVWRRWTPPPRTLDPRCRSRPMLIAVTASRNSGAGSRTGPNTMLPSPTWEPDGLVHRRGDRGLARGAAHHAGRATALFVPSDHDGADAQGRIPFGSAPDRRPDRLHHRPARPDAARAGPHDPEPPGSDAGGTPATVEQQSRCWG